MAESVFYNWVQVKQLSCVLQVKDSSVEHSEIKVGDVITHVNGVPFSNAAEVYIS